MEVFKYIKKIKIKGLWSKFDINWELNPDVNVLSGINGSGKSTILKLVDDTFIDLSISEDIAKNIEVILNTREVFKYGSTIEKIFSGENIGDKNQLLLGDGSKLIFDFIKSIDQQLLSREVIQKIANPEVKTELDFQLYKLIDKYNVYKGKLGSELSDAILKMDKKELLKFRKEKTQWSELFDKNVNRLFSSTQKMMINNGALSFKINNDVISPYKLSSGEKQLLIILLTTLLQDGKPAILLMDEPEISLHTDWQEELIKVIRTLNPNVQIILATHSPSIIMNGWFNKVTTVEEIKTPIK